MAKRGRKSAASLTVVQVPQWERPAAPRRLNARGKARWKNIVANYPADYFRPADLGLLENFVWVEGELEEMRKVIEKEGRTVDGERHPLLVDIHQFVGNLAGLAVKLRLCPSTRMKEQHGGVNNPAAPTESKPRQRKPLWSR